jgi:site-specific DNA-methyltransferase (adenine-specific)
MRRRRTKDGQQTVENKEMELDRVVNANCIEWLSQQEPGFADLIFADPPFNIGYQYDVYEDKLAYEEYHEWTRQWMAGCVRALTETGTFWIAIGDEYAAEIRMLGRQLGLTLRNWVIWHYTFGQNTKRKFCRSHAHLFYFVRNPMNFTFNEQAVRVFSDRQREYHDKRANPAGRLPDDTWSEFARVCGTFGEREGWHPCQMPEALLARIIRSCSKIGDLVFDPFAGSGTTLVAAKRLSRRWLGTELSPNYIQGIRDRLAKTTPVAACEPNTNGQAWPEEHLAELRGAYADQAVSTTLLYENRHLLDAFTEQFNQRLAEAGVTGKYDARQVWHQLELLRPICGELPRIKTHVAEPLGKPRPLEGGLFG